MSDPTESGHILLDRPADRVVRLTLNRPEKLNALTYRMVGELFFALDAIAADPEARVVIITGAGRGFCAGHERGDDSSAPWVSGDPSDFERRSLTVDRYFQLPTRLREMPQVVISAINGPAAGAGLALALGADLAVAAQSARFVNGFVNTGGISTEFGLTQLLPRVIGTQRAARLLIAADDIDAPTAERWGLVAWLVNDEVLQSSVLEVAERLAARGSSLRRSKSIFWSGEAMSSVSEAAKAEGQAQLLARQARIELAKEAK